MALRQNSRKNRHAVYPRCTRDGSCQVVSGLWHVNTTVRTHLISYPSGAALASTHTRRRRQLGANAQTALVHRASDSRTDKEQPRYILTGVGVVDHVDLESKDSRDSDDGVGERGGEGCKGARWRKLFVRL